MSRDDHASGGAHPTGGDPASPICLRAGPLSLTFDRGELRWLRLGDREVLRGIYAAVRTPDWATVPAVIEGLEVEAGDDHFALTFRARHRQGPLRFEWDGRIRGSADGRVRFDMDGVARSTFLRNRIGLCVLHPVEECAGAACVVETADGASTPETFPHLVSPHQPFLGVRALRHEVRPGVEAEVRLEGEVFETEDQRNWSDASFKTYSTPLSLPLPVEVREGERIRQSVTLSVHGAEGRVARGRGGWLSDDVIRVAVDDAVSRPWLRLGLGLSASPVSPEAADRVRALAPSHLRVDVRPSEGGWREGLGRAAALAQACGTDLEVAAFVSAEKATAELAELADVAQTTGAPVDAWLVFDAVTGTTTPDLAARARDRLAPGGVSLLGGGTDRFFADLNRQRAAAEGLDLVSFSLVPQVHASDDATMVENTTSLGWMAETARAFAGDTPLALSPVTLVRRPGADARQRTFFGAGWTLGLVAAASAAGFGRLTLFEVQGPGGVMDNGQLLPVGQLLAELGALATGSPDARVVHAEAEDRRRCLTLAVQAKRLLRVYVFNATPRTQDVVVTGLPPEVWRRDLRSGTAAVAGAVRVPEEATGQRVTAARDGLALRLGGHGILALDAERDGSWSR